MTTSISITAAQLADRFIGTEEVPGIASNPAVLSMLRLDNKWPEGDHVPWCSAFVNYICWLLGIPRSRSLRARSWLQVGQPVNLEDAEKGFDVVVLKRGSGDQPGPDVIDAPGHVGLFIDHAFDHVYVLGGNQSDAVSVARFPVSQILGIRRIYT